MQCCLASLFDRFMALVLGDRLFDFAAYFLDMQGRNSYSSTIQKQYPIKNFSAELNC